MKIKLSYKLFMTFLVTSLIIAVLMLVMQYYAFLNFTDYVNKVELEKLSELVNILGEEYQKYQGWNPLKNNLRNWHLILMHAGIDPPPPRPLRRPIPHSRLPHDLPPEKNPDMRPDMRNDQHHPPPHHMDEDENGQDRMPPEDALRIGRRLSLFDAQKQRIIGNPLLEHQTLKEITVDGEIVGWLGLRKRKQLSDPLETAFLKQQYNLFYLTGAGILILTLIVSFFLSKHILTPIRQLAAGTQALTSRSFKTRIHVRSHDELGQLASAFNVMAQTLETYENMRQQWITDISHELRTPLSILQGEIEAIQDGIRDMNESTLASLHAEVIRTSKLVNDLHLLSLADSQNLFFKKEPVKPVHILNETLDMFKIKLMQQKIDTDLSADDSNPVISGDADRLKQLFSNLLENVLRYTNSPGKLKIRAIHTKPLLTISFEDSEPGVPEASLSRLFERLYRVDKSRSRAKGGSGLGLAICKEIVEHHNGKIWAEHAPLGGLMIKIEFSVL